MKKANKAIALALAAVVAITPVSYTYAAEYEGEHGDLGELTENQEEDGHSTFAVIKAKSSPQNVSFEVPLYVTMAVVGGETAVVMPNKYSINNTSRKFTEGGTEDYDGYSIAVVGISFTKLEGAKYATVETLGTEYTEMMFSIGGVIMPAIDALQGEVTRDADMKGYESVFYKENAFVSIPPIGETEMKIPLEATLSATPDLGNNVGVAAQFKVCYTVSALGTNGDVLGLVYAGDDKLKAGLD